MFYGVILAGGEGTRLWPESDASRPKPFLTPLGESTLLEETVCRIRPLFPNGRLLISTAQRDAPAISRLFPDFESDSILTEPFVRNTAPAVAMAAMEIQRRDPEGIMAILPSDHYIDSAESLRLLLTAAAELVEEDSRRLVTLGIRPDRPSVAYGYMRAERPLLSAAAVRNHPSVCSWIVESFHEKPNAETAANYLKNGHYFWNAGIFVWKARRILDLIRLHAPDLAVGLERIKTSFGQVDSDAVCVREFERLRSVSIDVAVLEKTDGIVLLEAPFHWSDLGGFESISALNADRADAAGNLSLGITTETIESTGNIVRWNLGVEEIDESPAGKGENSAANSVKRNEGVEREREKRFDGSETACVVTPSERGEEILALAGVDDLMIVRRGRFTLIAKKGRDDLIRTLAKRFRVEDASFSTDVKSRPVDAEKATDTADES